MTPPDEDLFGQEVWRPALEKFCAVTHLTVTLWADQRVICGPIHPTPLFEVFAQNGYEPGIFADCARRCLAQALDRPAVVVASAHGLAAVGTSLVLEGEIVGAAVAGYALFDFPQSSAIELLAREAGIPFARLWEIARREQPVPKRRLVLHGELLQVLGDSILRENHRARLYEATAAALRVASTAKDEFIAMLGHEIRNPLAAVIHSVEVMRRGSSLTPDAKRLMGVVDRQARHLGRIADDLLDVSRIGSHKKVLDRRPVDLRDVARNAVEELQAAGRDEAHPVSLVLPDEPLIVDGDAGRFGQVLGNLLGNAVKYTPIGGSIELRAERRGDRACISVRDEGSGIEAALLPRIFEPFTQGKAALDRSRGGLGLGLALVKALVEEHGGTVEVHSAGAGKGSEFVIELPLGAATVTPVAADPPPTISPLRIVLVEDNADAREALRELLCFEGHVVDTAADGLAGLRAIYDHRPDVAIVDIGLPLLDGYQVAQRVRADRGLAGVRLVALTGYGQPKDRERATAAGFDTHIVKPVDADHLMRSLAEPGSNGSPADGITTVKQGQ
ncbi:MAG: ATP-binding protein [Chloroflexota bacterium]|nr:ATP-binding protein [Chloroflexota bacterium]